MDEIEYYKNIAQETGKRYLREVRKLSKIIADKIKTEEALRAAEERYRNIFENAPEGIFQFAPSGRFLNVNPAMARMLGFASPNEVVSTISDIEKEIFAVPDDANRFKILLDKEGKVEGFEAQLLRADGSKFWASINIRTIGDRETNSICYEGTCEDITERKRLEQQLRQAQKMEAIGTLAGGIAHDFNNILTTIIGNASLVKMKMEKDDPRGKYLDQINAASHKAADLIKNLLAFSRRQPIKLEPVDINSEMRNMEKLLKRLIPESIELAIIPSKGQPVVMADKTQLSQILFNLVSNAKDAMPDGGAITIEIDLCRMDEDFIRANGFGREGDYALIKVSDTGEGMDNKTMTKIFDPFFTTKEHGKGTGLGLSTVYGIVKQHEGYITVNSAPGEGAAFFVYLPAVKMKPSIEIVNDETISGGNERIILAEDDDDVRYFIREVLESYGYRVIEARDGEEAVRIFNERKDIDLIITDLIMPKKNGWKVYEEVRRLKESVKVIFISGYARNIMFRLETKDVSHNFLQKPLSANTLLKKVREALLSG